MKKYLITLSLIIAAVAAYASYDVAAIVWPAYHPEPRWRELGIFGHTQDRKSVV